MLARVGPGSAALDVCCGTGDFAFALRRAVGPRGPGGRRGRLGGDAGRRPGEVRPQPALRGVPPRRRARPALPRRRRRSAGGGPAGAGFDACTVGFGIRNVPDIVRAFSEMRRVCRPGGRVVCLEITQARIPVFKQFYDLWFDQAVPRLGRLAAGDEFAYSYLPASVRRFPGPGRAEGPDGGGRPAERALRDPGRRDHRPASRGGVGAGRRVRARSECGRAPAGGAATN